MSGFSSLAHSHATCVLRSHNYEVTAYEAFLDIYVLTGNTTYLAAVMSAWSMLRAHWILPGGSFALNEGNYYPPDSYYIGFTGTNVASAHDHSAHVHVNNASDPYYHAPCMAGPGVANESPLEVLRADAKQPSPPLGGPNDSDPPTGELCGNVFWAKLNQRLHHLEPDNEAYVAEIERSIINVGLAALGRPGSYLHLTPAAGWPLGASTIAFDLAMRFQAIQYTGHSQLPPYARWAYLVGPVLLSLEGPWDSASDSLVMPSGLDPANPAQWLQTDPDNPLHFGVPGFDEYSAKPYFEVQEAGERFSNYPCFSM